MKEANTIAYRMRPGGSAFPHMLAGVIFMAFGGFLLLKALRRGIALKGKPVRFCDVHIPERDHGFLWNLSLVVCVVPLVGMAILALIFHDFLRHPLLLFPFVAVGVVGLLEAKEKLPPDAHRKMFGLVNFISSLALYGHAGGWDEGLHLCMALSCLFTALAIGYSIQFPESTEAYIMGHAGIFLFGAWWFVTGIIVCRYELGIGDDMMNMHAYGYFGVVIVVEAFIIAVVSAIYIPYNEQYDYEQQQQARHTFSPLNGTEELGDEEEANRMDFHKDKNVEIF